MFEDIKELKKERNYLRLLIILLIIAVGIHLFTITWEVLQNFSDIIVILLIAWLVSFILEPLVENIKTVFRVSRLLATTITFLLLTLILLMVVLLFIPTVTAQVKTLAVIIPKFLQTTPPFVTNIINGFIASLANAISYIPSVAQFFFSLLITLILSFYFIVDKQRINKEIYTLTPKSWHEYMQIGQDIIDHTFASFVRVQILFGIMGGIITFVVLVLFGIEFAASTALLAGIFAVVPLVGPFLSILPPVFVALVVDPVKALIIFAILLVAQQVIFNVVGPKLLGKALSIHPGIVLLSFLVGIKIAGGIGAILAIPVLGILTIVVRDFSHHFLGGNKEVKEK